MNFLEYYKPINAWKSVHKELPMNLDFHSMIYVNAVVSFANMCKSMTDGSIESFYDTYKGFSSSALILFEIYGAKEINTKLLSLYATTIGPRYTDIDNYKENINKIEQYGDKRVLAIYLGCLADMAQNLGTKRILDLVNDSSILKDTPNKKLKI